MANSDRGCTLSICLLGQFSVKMNGVEVQIKQWKSKKALNLFKFLALKKGQKISKDILVEQFWADGDDGDDATHKLHSTMYLLRKTLQISDSQLDSTTLIHYSDGLYWLDESDDIWVDTLEFEMMCRLANELRTEDPAGAIVAFDKALNLYKGDLLPETQYQDWSTVAREYYHEMFLEISAKKAELLAFSSNYLEAIKCCRNALRIDQYCENIHHLLLRYLIESGQYAEAVRHYRDFTKALYHELGLVPSPETKKLYDDLKKRTNSQTDHNDITDDAELYAGPFICDRDTFNSIFNLELRKQRRSKEPIALVKIPLKTQVKNKTNIIQAICSSLRQSDVLCADSDDELMLQLHNTNELGMRVVKARLEKALLFYTAFVGRIDVKILNG